MYRSSAALVRYLAHQYGIPLDRAHIIGHDNVPGPTNHLTVVQQWDPGPYWDWNHYMALLHGVSDQAEQAADGSTGAGEHRVVMISPDFASNQPPVTDCSSGTLPATAVVLAISGALALVIFGVVRFMIRRRSGRNASLV